MANGMEKSQPSYPVAPRRRDAGRAKAGQISHLNDPALRGGGATGARVLR